MLVLTRSTRPGDNQIIVDGPAVITINHVRGRHVTVGVAADKGTKIVRAEVANRPPRKKPDPATEA